MVDRIGNVFGDFVGRFINIPKSVSFINNHQIPSDSMYFLGSGRREVIRTNNDLVCLIEWVCLARLAKPFVALRFQDNRRQVELFL